MENNPGQNNNPIDNNNNASHQEIENSSTILAIYENERTKYEIGIATIDLGLTTIALSQFVDNQSYTNLLNKIEIINPCEVLISTSFQNANINHLFNLIEKNIVNTKITTIKSRYFYKKKGLEYINKLCIVDFKIYSELFSKNLALSACSALIKYVEFAKNFQFYPNSIRLCLEGNKSLAYIDSSTNKYLELVYNSRNFKSANNLYGILNYAGTKNGMKTLRASILQPSCCIETIQDRVDIVEKLKSNKDLFNCLRASIKSFNSLEEIVSFCSRPTTNTFESIKATESKIQNIFNIKLILQYVKCLKEIIDGPDCEPIKKFFYNLYEEKKFENLETEIEKIIEESLNPSKNPLTSRIHKCFAIKANINGLLDVSRRAYTEILQEVQNYADSLSESLNLPINYTFNLTRGFFLHINCKGLRQKTRLDTSGSSLFSTNSMKLLENLPKDFIKITKNSSSIQFTTQKLLKINERINSSIEDIYYISNNIIDKLIADMRENFDVFYKLREFLSLLDMELSLAHYSLTLKTCAKPEFGSDLILENAIHPVLSKIKDDASNELSNDLFIQNENTVENSLKINNNTPFLLITGANMSGKSTLLKQIGNIQVMSQCGSYIPATKANINIKRHILSLSGDHSDSNGITLSSFEKEISEIKNIIQSLENDSLILIDELCRSTNYYEGLALSFAICEYLLENISGQNKNIFVLFATHYKELSCLEYCYSSLKTYHLESILDDNQRLCHTFKLEKGVCEMNNYGLKLVEVSSLPKSIIENVKYFSKFFLTNSKNIFQHDKKDLKKELIFEAYNQLQEINQIKDDYELVERVEKLYNHFVNSYTKLDQI